MAVRARGSLIFRGLGGALRRSCGFRPPGRFGNCGDSPLKTPATRVDRVNVGRNLLKLAVAVMLAVLHNTKCSMISRSVDPLMRLMVLMRSTGSLQGFTVTDSFIWRTLPIMKLTCFQQLGLPLV